MSNALYGFNVFIGAICWFTLIFRFWTAAERPLTWRDGLIVAYAYFMVQ